MHAHDPAVTDKSAAHVHRPTMVSSCWELRTVRPSHDRAIRTCRNSSRYDTSFAQACHDNTASPRSPAIHPEKETRLISCWSCGSSVCACWEGAHHLLLFVASSSRGQHLLMCSTCTVLSAEYCLATECMLLCQSSCSCHLLSEKQCASGISRQDILGCVLYIHDHQGVHHIKASAEGAWLVFVNMLCSLFFLQTSSALHLPVCELYGYVVLILITILTNATSSRCSPVSSPQKSKHITPDKQTAHMSGNQLEAWWGLSPADLALVQADPSIKPAPTHPIAGARASSMLRSSSCGHNGQLRLSLSLAVQLHVSATLLKPQLRLLLEYITPVQLHCAMTTATATK